MALLNRETLKSFFSKGTSPSEEHFAELIDSSVNKIDDGFAKSIEEGLQLAPQGQSAKVMSLYYNQVDEQADWQISLPNKDGEKGFKIQNREGQSALFVNNKAQVGIQTIQPHHALEVNGFTGTRGRVGTFFKGKVPGDGKWRNLLVRLDQPQIYEVVARIDGAPKSGKYAIAHAIAACTYGGGRNKIRMTQSHYSWFFDKLQMRWKEEGNGLRLQIRTRGHYGEDANEKPYFIKFHITQLWDESQEFEEIDETLAQHEKK
ncbi:MAG: hypothetical protein AAF985_00030 [Bacteroidota bacterium]